MAYKFFKLQWHITGNCNLRCSHCYQDNYENKETEITDYKDLCLKFKELLAFLSGKEGREIRGHISITGGEPMLHKEFYKIAQYISKDPQLQYSVLTNGCFIDPNAVSFFRDNPPLFVQLSLEGNQETHDKIRGTGDYSRTCNTARMLVQSEIRTMLSFTAHKDNYKDLSEVVRTARELRVHKVWSDRMIPMGSGKQLPVLTKEETAEYITILKKVKNDTRYARSRCEVSADRALQFSAGGSVYSCKAGKSLLTVMPDGWVLPCRRMPVTVGNINSSSLTDIYTNNELLQKLRENDSIEGCNDCKYLGRCKGGLRCLSYSVNGSPFGKDPGCFVRF